MIPGDRVIVAHDRRAERSPRVRPLTGHRGTVESVNALPLPPRIKVLLDGIGFAFFQTDELEVLP